ncbi:MAG TPA: efflux RND transporter periplasmic adaptor subunit, partial [candidate division Zixibacteria bacterium]|nr:efflux RND transporter periplasmic adaptor subunit [candidate division Zixibacteria bacterium]
TRSTTGQPAMQGRMADKSVARAWAPALFGALALGLVACGGEREAANAGAGEASVMTAQTDKPATEPAVVTVAVVRETAPRQSVRFSAVARGVREARLEASRPARIERILVSAGERVAAGAPLIELESDVERLAAQSAEAAVLSAESNLRNARLDRERAERKFADGLISEAQRDRAVYAFDQAQAAHKSALAALELARYNFKEMTITAPIDGEVGRLPFELGETPPRGAMVAEVIDRSHVILDLYLAERDLPLVTVGASVSASSAVMPGAEFPGEIRTISPKADERSKLFAAEALIENAAGSLRPGMTLAAEVFFPGVDSGVYIPRDVALSRATGATVALLVAGRVQFQPITLGQAVNNTARALTGLRPGDLLIVSGMEALEDGDSVRVLEEAPLDSLLN